MHIAICENGHVVQFGADTITVCPVCSATIVRIESQPEGK